jgi:predicted PolB exonuclease-like 3'-5' exonuclease
MKFLCLDIEAVVDPGIWTPPADDLDAFAPPQAWRPICIGMVLLEVGPKMVITRRIGALEEAQERDLLTRFGETVTKLQPCTLVTWNGRGYDLPVLMLRSLRYGLAHGWYYGGKQTRYRFSEEGHCDLMDAMTDYGGARGLKLDELARLIGLPGKPKGADEVCGRNVGAAYAAGRLPEITAYCVADAVQTAFLFLRWKLLQGACTTDEYRAGAAALLDACDHDARLGGLVASVDRRVLLLERGEEKAA